MLDLATMTEFFGWCALLNILMLSITTVAITLFKQPLITYHHKLFGVTESNLAHVYFSYLSFYKLATLVLCVVPYLALKIIA